MKSNINLLFKIITEFFNFNQKPTEVAFKMKSICFEF